MLFAPRRDRPVDPQQIRVRADEQGEPAQHHATDDEDDQAEGQQETGLGARDRGALQRALPTRVPLELVRDHVRAARRRGVDPGVAAHREREQRTEQQCGPEQHEGDEQSRLLDARLTLCADVYRVSTPVKPLPWTTGRRAPDGSPRPSARGHREPSPSSASSSLAACALALGALVTNLVVGHSPRPRRRRRRAVVRRPADAHVERSLVGRLVRRRDGDRVRVLAGIAVVILAWHRCWPQCALIVVTMLVEAGGVPRRHLLREPEPARGAPARGPHQRRQLPLRPHRGVGRALRIARDRRVVADPESPGGAGSSSPSPSSRRSSWPRPACTAGCTTSPTSCRGALLGAGCVAVGYVAVRAGMESAHERRVERAAAPRPPTRGGGLMTSVAVVAHARQDPRRRPAGAASGAGRRRRRRPDLVRGAEEQVRAEVRAARRSATAPTSCFVWGGDGMVQRCIDAVGDAPVPLAILPAGTGNLLARNLGIPIDLQAAVEVGVARRPPDDRRRSRQRRAVRGHGRHRARRADDPRRRPRAQGPVRPRRVRVDRRQAPPAAVPFRAQDRRRRQPVVRRRDRVHPRRQRAARCSAASRRSTTPAPRTDGSSSAWSPPRAIAQWTRALVRTAAGSADQSKFVRTTKAQKIRVKLDRKMPYELDGGDEKPVDRLKIRVRTGGGHRLRPGGGGHERSNAWCPRPGSSAATMHARRCSAPGACVSCRDAFVRFRASDGFSHARSLAFVTSLLLVQGVIVLVGIAAALGDTDLSASIVRAITEAVPGPAGKALTNAVFHAYRDRRVAVSTSSSSSSGVDARSSPGPR